MLRSVSRTARTRGRTRLWGYAVHGANAPCAWAGSPGTGANSRPLNRRPLSSCLPRPRELPLNGAYLKIETDRENLNMNRFLRKDVRNSWLSSSLFTIGLTLLVAATAFDHTGTSP